MNEENKVLIDFLINNIDGIYIFNSSKNSKELEKKTREYHNNKGIPNWHFEDDINEGIDWITFNDVFILISSELKYSDYLDDEMKGY